MDINDSESTVVYVGGDIADTSEAVPTLGVAVSPMRSVDRQTCSLLGPFALVVQGFMGLIVLGSLILKRQKEQSKRPWIVWVGDVSKQAIGQLFVHFSNVFISDIIAGYRENACALYFLNILVDTTLGVFLIWLFMRMASRWLIEKWGLLEFRSGRYGHPFSRKTWAKQLLVYLGTLALMKICVVLLFLIFPILVRLGNWAVGWLGEEEAQLAFSMMIFPLIMNVLQFVLVDSIIKSPGLEEWRDDHYDIEAEYNALVGPDDEDDEVGGQQPVALKSPATPTTATTYPPPRKSQDKPTHADSAPENPEADEWERCWDDD